MCSQLFLGPPRYLEHRTCQVTFLRAQGPRMLVPRAAHQQQWRANRPRGQLPQKGPAVTVRTVLGSWSWERAQLAGASVLDLCAPFLTVTEHPPQ